jgi:hypothetical protein
MPSDGFELAIIHNKSTVQVLFLLMARECRELSLLVSRVERLDLRCSHLLLELVMNPMLWLELFQPFIAVQNLFISKDVWPDVVPVYYESS